MASARELLARQRAEQHADHVRDLVLGGLAVAVTARLISAGESSTRLAAQVPAAASAAPRACPSMTSERMLTPWKTLSIATHCGPVRLQDAQQLGVDVRESPGRRPGGARAGSPPCRRAPSPDRPDRHAPPQPLAAGVDAEHAHRAMVPLSRRPQPRC
jgi:hypothetical protein